MRRVFSTIVVFLLLSLGYADAQELPTVDHALCLGFDPELGTWGIKGSPAPTGVKSECPTGQAFFGTLMELGPIIAGDEVSMVGFCCPLPEGSLTGEHSYAAETCPENSVATGAAQGPEKKSKVPTYLLRCTKINSERFLLGPARDGARVAASKEYFSDAVRQFFPSLIGEYTPRLAWGSMPMSLRYGLGRVSLLSWVAEFCVGNPPGSVLVGKSGKLCNERRYRQLRLKDTSSAGSNAEAKGRECLSIDNMFSPQARCLR